MTYFTVGVVFGCFVGALWDLPWRKFRVERMGGSRREGE